MLNPIKYEYLDGFDSNGYHLPQNEATIGCRCGSLASPVSWWAPSPLGYQKAARVLKKHSISNTFKNCHHHCPMRVQIEGQVWYQVCRCHLEDRLQELPTELHRWDCQTPICPTQWPQSSDSQHHAGVGLYKEQEEGIYWHWLQICSCWTCNHI